MLTDLLLLLFSAIISVILLRRLRMSNIVAYLFAGFLLGPSLFNLIDYHQEIELIAEFGIVFLMFSLGLQFSVKTLIKMRRLVFGVGALQVFFSFSLFYLLSQFFAMTWQQSFTIAGILTMSSTAIIVKLLSDQQRLHSRAGKLSISILLFQDLAVVPFLITIPIIAMPMLPGELMYELLNAFMKGSFAVLVLLSIGRWILPKFFDEIGTLRFDEIFILSALFVTLCSAWFTQKLGLSMALGSFLAGMMLAESHYRHQISADIRPFKDILMAVFFISIGSLLDFNVLKDNVWLLLLLVFVLISAKIISISVAMLVMKERVNIALSVGISLAQMGEFGFILVALGSKYQILDASLSSLLIAAGVISMSLTPILVKYSQVISTGVLHHSEKVLRPKKILPGQYTDHTIICGYGRVGQTLCRFMRAQSLPFVVLDRDPVRIKDADKKGVKVDFGDANSADILLLCGIKSAKLLVITFDDLDKSLALLAQVRVLNSNVKVLVRTSNEIGCARLRAGGANYAIGEVLEGGLMLAAQVLFLSGTSRKNITAELEAERQRYGLPMSCFFDKSHKPESERSMAPLYVMQLKHEDMLIGRRFNAKDFPHIDLQSWRCKKGACIEIATDDVFKEGDILLLSGNKTAISAVLKMYRGSM
ncbi:sodium/hydrogen exchanger [Psychromonas sp. CNPT3]|uniref:cation:proton antiporter n=1 Tax=Psychromonas sp. CNPT3 TaxID=314282 RepID=UPI00006E5842|nr:cation:proton antiporter [Psychromonas sp. CNPT3]AGH81969.1 sodium/hydrogen exchanger [Psychromonas sp. CNPT3]